MRDYITGFVIGIIMAALIMYFNIIKPQNDRIINLQEQLDKRVESIVNAKMDSLKRLPIDSVIIWIQQRPSAK